jgi:hypothetical protein
MVVPIYEEAQQDARARYRFQPSSDVAQYEREHDETKG